MISRYFAAGYLSLLLTIVGCTADTPANPPNSTQQTDSDSIEETVTEIAELRDRIRDGFAAGNVDEAHGPLHDVGSCLEELSDLIANSELSGDDKQALEEHINTLFDSFGEVDKTLHGQDGSTYEEESATIDDAIENLVRSCTRQ
jgi:hypothetical protein